MSVSTAGATQSNTPREGQLLFRYLMVLSSLAPLFLLLGVRGAPVIDGKPIIAQSIYLAICLAFMALPSFFLGLRIHTAGKTQDVRELSIGSATDHRDHLLAYLFATIIPLYQNNYNSMRDIVAEIGVIAFVLILFTHMNLHYMNIFFAMAGYRVFTVETDDANNMMSGRQPFVLLTKRHTLRRDQKIVARRISDTVFIEM